MNEFSFDGQHELFVEDTKSFYREDQKDPVASAILIQARAIMALAIAVSNLNETYREINE